MIWQASSRSVMPYGARDDGDDADASQALLSAEEADDAAADRRMRLAGEPAPEPEHRSTLLTVTPWILGNEFCERLAYYGCAVLQSRLLPDALPQQHGTACVVVVRCPALGRLRTCY